MDIKRNNKIIELNRRIKKDKFYCLKTLLGAMSSTYTTRILCAIQTLSFNGKETSQAEVSRHIGISQNRLSRNFQALIKSGILIQSKTGISNEKKLVIDDWIIRQLKQCSKISDEHYYNN